MRKLFFLVTMIVSSVQLQADILSKRDAAKKEFLDIDQEESFKEISIKKIELDEHSVSLDKRSQMLALLAQHAEKNKLLELKSDTKNDEQKKINILSDDSDVFRVKVKNIVVAIGLQEYENEKTEKIAQERSHQISQDNIVDEGRICDIDSITSQITWIINKFKEWTITACDGTYFTSEQTQDVMYDGRLHQQILYFDKDHLCTGSTLIPYETNGKSNDSQAILTHFYEPIAINKSSQVAHQPIQYVVGMDKIMNDQARAEAVYRQNSLAGLQRYDAQLRQQEIERYYQSDDYKKQVADALARLDALKRIPKILKEPVKPTPPTRRERLGDWIFCRPSRDEIYEKNLQQYHAQQGALENQKKAAEVKAVISQPIAPSAQSTNQASPALPVGQKAEQPVEQKIVSAASETVSQPVKTVTQDSSIIHNPGHQNSVNSQKKENLDTARPDNKNSDAKGSLSDKMHHISDRIKEFKIIAQEKQASLQSKKSNDQINGKKDDAPLVMPNSQSLQIKSASGTAQSKSDRNDSMQKILGEVKKSIAVEKNKKNKAAEKQESDQETKSDKDQVEKGKSQGKESTQTEKNSSNNGQNRIELENKIKEFQQEKKSIIDNPVGSSHQNSSYQSPNQYSYNQYQSKPYNPYVYSGYSQSPSQLSSSNQKKQGPQHVLDRNNKSTTWDRVVASYKEASAQVYEQQQQQRERDQQQAQLEWAIEQQRIAQAEKVRKANLLHRYGYTYQPSEKDAAELTKNRLELKSARDSYNAMGNFSYDYWISNKPAELRKIIQDSDSRSRQIEANIKYAREQWEKQSLQEIADKEKARLLQEQAEKMRADQAAIERKKAAIALFPEYGYEFNASEKVNQTLQEVQRELQDVIAQSKQPLSIYDYWLHNNTKELAQKIQNLTRDEKAAQAEIEQEHQDWENKSLDEVYAIQNDQALQAKLLKKIEDEKNADLEFEALEKERLNNKILRPDVQIIDAVVDMKKLTQYVHTDQSSKKALIKDSEHRYNMPVLVAQTLRKKCIDQNNEYSKKINKDEIAMIDCMLNSMIYAQSSMRVEFAQAGLQAWNNAQSAQTDEEYDLHRKKFEQCYNWLNQKNQAINDQVKPVSAHELDTMLQGCHNALESNKHEILLDQQQMNDENVARIEHVALIEKRAQALTESQEQLRTNTLVSKDFKMSSDARSYLMANNLNYAAFDSILATNIQHCLTQENLDIIESVVEMSQRYEYRPETREFVKRTCDLAIVAQQLNQRSQVKQAAALTDLSRISAYFAQFTIEEDPEMMAFIFAGKALSKSLYKLAQITKQLCCDPGKTGRELLETLNQVGTGLCDLASVAYDHSSLAAQEDRHQDRMESYQNHNNDSAEDSNKLTHVEKRALKNQQTSQNIAIMVETLKESIKQRSLEENVTDCLEMMFDVILTNKAIEGIAYVSGKIGNQLVKTGNQLKKLIPEPIIDEAVIFMQTSTGENIAVSQKTLQNLDVVACNQQAIHRAAKITRVEELIDKIQQLTKVDKVKIAKLRKSLKPFVSSEAVVSSERLKATKGIKQIENFRIKTNNFDPKILELLHPDEKLYLNLCDWLYPQSVEINKELKAMGGLIIRDPSNASVFVKIEEFDVFHSLLGEMRPGSIQQNLKGGHMMILELKEALCEFDEMQPYWDGFIDLPMKLKRGNAEGFITKSFFPYGNSPADCTTIVKDAIKNIVQDHTIINLTPSKINFFDMTTDINNVIKFTLEIENNSGQVFKFYVENGQAKYFPFSPLNYK